jgi:hypothetical protein
MSFHEKINSTKAGQHTLLCQNCFTEEIIQAILTADKNAKAQAKELSIQFQGKKILDICESLYHWVRTSITYKEDPPGKQLVKSPAALYRSRKQHLGGNGSGGDCKSMSIFCAGILQNLGIKYTYRFISESLENDYHHVYIMVEDEYKKQIALDCVHHTFNQEPYHKKYVDYLTTASTSGKIGNTLTQASEWNSKIENWKQLYGKPLDEINFLASLRDYLAANKFKNKPIKRRQALDFLVGLIRHGSVYLFYAFWDNTKAPFPSKLQPKRNYALTVFSQLKNDLGLREDHIYRIADYATYKDYGLPLDLMLEKLYNIEKHGQQWPVRNGVPYYDQRINQWFDNGSGKLVLIWMCVPYNAWQIPPQGVPYWALGGFLMLNGTDPNSQFFNDWLKRNKRPTQIPSRKNGPLTLQAAPYPTEAETSTEAYKAQVSLAMKYFNEWMGGQVPIKQGSKISHMGGKPNMSGNSIGLDPTAIMGIVSGAMAAIGQVITSILEIIRQFKQPNLDSNAGPIQVNNPAQDFGQAFYTERGTIMYWIDGRYVEHDQSGNIINPNPDMNDPRNQPAGQRNRAARGWLIAGIAAVGAFFIIK